MTGLVGRRRKRAHRSMPDRNILWSSNKHPGLITDQEPVFEPLMLELLARLGMAAEYRTPAAPA
ncbi:hypothetical protein EDD90_1595 [Streptomyces sp. Ag109_O5-1]|nr:hypothetical protein EDD90_1595 [Streptomyces sp. Ag109_O5-1]